MTAQPLRKSQGRSVQSRHHPSIQTAQRDSFQQRECSHLGSTVSEAEREFDFETRRQAERQKRWQRQRERGGGDRAGLSWSY